MVLYFSISLCFSSAQYFSIAVYFYISAGGRALAVDGQGCLLLRAVRGGAAGGQGGHCHRGDELLQLFINVSFKRVCFLGDAAPCGQLEAELRKGAH